MTVRSFLTVLALGVLASLPALAGDVTGKWTASFETQIGVQNYTYIFKVDGEKLTGTTESQHGKSDIADGVVKGEDISFTENLKFQDQMLRITYKGKVAGDEIKFTRQVGDFGTEDLVAKRTK